MVFGKKGYGTGESKKFLFVLIIGVVLGVALAYLVPQVLDFVADLLAKQGVQPLG